MLVTLLHTYKVKEGASPIVMNLVLILQLSFWSCAVFNLKYILETGKTFLCRK